MARSQISETLPEQNQEIRVNKIQSKIPEGYIVHYTIEEEGKPVLVCYNPVEKDPTKAYKRVEV